MKLEVLYPELSNILGDMGNVRYLQACAPDLEVIYTGNLDTPFCASGRPDMIYIGPMSERKQELAASRLKPYGNRLRELIEEDVIVLATGNGAELFGEYIADGDRKIPALGFFPFYAKRNMSKRHNSMFVGKFEDMEIVGNKSQFSFAYGTFGEPFAQVELGYGMNPEAQTEGIRYHNLFATYLLGPLLVLNPDFTKYLLRLMGHDDSIAFEKQAREAYECRLNQLKQPGARILMTRI